MPELGVGSLVLGTIGGLIGSVTAFIALATGGGSVAGRAAGMEHAVSVGWFILLWALLGIAGGTLALARPKASGWLQIIAAVGGFAAMSAAWSVAFFFLLPGAVLAFWSSRRDEPAPSTPN